MPDSPVQDTLVEDVRIKKVDNVEKTITAKIKCEASIVCAEVNLQYLKVGNDEPRIT